MWVLGLLLGVPALLLGVLVLSPHFMGGSADVEEIADRIELPATWVLENEQVTPRMLGCWDGNACPSVNRLWESETPLSAEEFLALVEAIGGDPRNVESPDLCGTQVQGCSTDFRLDHWGEVFWVYLSTGAPNDVAWETDAADYDGKYTLGLIVQIA